MSINDILNEKSLTKYRLSKLSGVPYATVSDICSGKAKIEKCAGDTLFKLSKTLGVTIESLLDDAMEYRCSFENFKSNVCHRVHDLGDMDFLIDTLESNRIRRLYDKKWYPETLYLLAMTDYISRENGLPICTEYDDIRRSKLQETLYPAGVLTLCAVTRSDNPKAESLSEAIPEFKRFNIIESDVRNVV
jgi:plasmid maintenance system antidote protein VapI